MLGFQVKAGILVVVAWSCNFVVALRFLSFHVKNPILLSKSGDEVLVKILKVLQQQP